MRGQILRLGGERFARLDAGSEEQFRHAVQCNSRLIEKLRGPGLYDSRVAGRWTSILVSLAAAMLLIVLVDGWAIAFLPRVVEKIVISAAFVVLVVVAVQELKGRDRQRA